jgi:iron complex outermembrane recepter protein
MQKFLLLCCLLLVSLTDLSAQTVNGKISGVVQDASGKPLPAVTVSLLRAKDTQLVKVAVTTKEGVYEFERIAAGAYRLVITSAGFDKWQSDELSIGAGNEQQQLKTVQLSPAVKGLSEVTLTSKRPFIEAKIDKTVVNVDASPTNAGATALEVLEKSPGVMVSNDGIISLRGKSGVIVMMDGKQTFLSPADLANLLKNLPASALDQIEIMTNPSARYDASGNSGIINIKTKKEKRVVSMVPS